MADTTSEIIVPRNVEDEMKESYLRYSMSVIISRALPDARDGLKPSQRRILFAMRQLNLSPGGKHRKCAKIAGDTSGDYHPHGEQVIYPTLVRMAQDWMMRYTLIDGQGNFGSVDGDPPAAMRYTEARLTHAAVQLMEDLDKDTVEMVPNYDETKKEPTVFPAKFPNLLSNGSSGIAVGMATNIPPHNLNELINATLLVLEDSHTSIEQIMEVMPAPDFPTGGLICGYRGVKEAFHTGRGRVILRGVIRIEDAKEGDRQRLIVDEIPYNVNKSRLIERIADLTNEKTIVGISDLRDESDKDGLRLVIDLKKGAIAEVIMNQLYKFSDLQVTFGCIMLALDNGRPRIMNIHRMISVWIDHRIDVIRRRTRFELNKAEARAHVLEGYLKAIDHMDEVIRIIKASNDRDEARKELIERFTFSERQANAVLDLRLYQLTGLERDKIQAEYDELQKKIDYYKAVLASEKMVRDIIKEELLEIQAKHKSPRKTLIVPAEGDMDTEDLIPNDATIVTISEDDYIKRMPIDTFREQRRGGQGVSGVHLKKETDAIKGVYFANAHDYLLIFTNLGRVYWLKVWQIPDAGRRSKGKPLINLLEDIREDERIATILRVETFEEAAYVVMATARGVVKKTNLDEFSNPRRKGVWALNIDDGDEVIAARLVRSGQQIMLFTRNGMAVRFDEGKTRSMGRLARGVRGVRLKDVDDRVVGLEGVKGDESLLIVCEHGHGKRSLVEDFRQTNRGGKGVRSIITSDRNGKVVAAICVSDEDSMVLMSAGGQTIRVNMSHLRVMGRNTQGVRIVKLRDDDMIVAVQKLEGVTSEEEDSVVPEELPEGEEVEIVEDLEEEEEDELVDDESET
ncbi:MAG: DNA topoisomerase (ATP-hydrolyzing) subunit A [Chlamydiales bacterium]|nr:DNA topoisomerase (ATP-hydrolyzing) subunit A [Chlamydiales bacterium]